jgi:hypothetical protein
MVIGNLIGNAFGNRRRIKCFSNRNEENGSNDSGGTMNPVAH